ncbi:hypothetical protein BKA62DRAFT_706244 [Auriculariales sp. MPI-PUGE-AT-0066]|nr:hypothetical protein BKA62DRAFT_706244 [Auriculariales sp. MPI-PUGE-AT-0066]
MFTHLPTELLHTILVNVILSESPAPKSIEEARATRRDLPVWKDVEAITVLTERKVPLPNSIGVLSTCRTLSDATRSVISFLESTNRIVFKMDVLVIGERELWPTWTCVPAIVTCVNRLEMSVRVADCYKEYILFGHYFFDAEPYVPQGSLCPSDSRNGTPPLMQAFYYLANALIRRGTSLDLDNVPQTHVPWPSDYPLAHRSLRRDRGIYVQTMEVGTSALESIELAPEDTLEDWLEARPSDSLLAADDAPIDDRTQRLRDLAIRPEWLARFIAMDVDSTLKDPAHGSLLYERLGTMRILVEGRLCTQIDVGERFAQLRERFGIGRGACHLTEFFQEQSGAARYRDWWQKALQTRLALKLGVGSAELFMNSHSVESVLLPLPPASKLPPASESTRDEDTRSTPRYSSARMFFLHQVVKRARSLMRTTKRSVAHV